MCGAMRDRPEACSDALPIYGDAPSMRAVPQDSPFMAL